MLVGYWRLVKQYPRYVSYACLHTFFSSLGQTFMFALFVPIINAEFGLSKSESGAYYGLITIASAFLLLYTGALLDRINLQKYSLAVGAALGLGAMLLSMAQHLWQLLLAWLCLRHCGQALMSLIASTSLARFFTLNRGKALGLKGFGIALGEAVLPAIVALALVWWGWRVSYALMALACWLVFLPAGAWLLRAHDPFADPAATEIGSDVKTSEGRPSLTRRQMLSHPFFWLTLPYLAMLPFLITGIFYHQAAVATMKGWSLPLLASMFVGYGVCRFSFAFLIGPAIDRWGALRLLPVVQMPFALGLALMMFFEASWVGYTYLALTGVSLGLAEGVHSAMYVEAYGRAHLGSIKSFMGMLMIFMTALSPPLGGWLLEQGVRLPVIFQYCVVMVLVFSVLAALAPAPKRTLIVKCGGAPETGEQATA
jgi:MFS family permease